MNKIYLKIFLFSLLIAHSSKAQVTIPHCDFTYWTIDTLGNPFPDGGWNYSTDFDSTPLMQDIDRTNGWAYSLKLISVFDSSQGIYQGGTIELNNQPFTGVVRPSTFNGFWKLNDPNAANIFLINISLYNSSQDLIGESMFTSPPGNITSWTNFSLPVNYSNNDPVASYDIYVLLLNIDGNPSLTAHIDDLSFDVVTDIPEKSFEDLYGFITGFDGNYVLQIQKKINSPLNVEVININGKIISRPFNGNCNSGNQTFEITLKDQRSGIYFCKVQTEGKTKLYKIIK